MGNTSKLALALVGLVLGASLVACGDGRAGAEDAAKQLATAVSALDVGSVGFDGKESGAANDQLKEIFQGLDPDKPAVQAGELTFDADTATFPLNYAWKVGAEEWKYTVSAQLKKSGDKWLTVWKPAMLVPDWLRARSSPGPRTPRSEPPSSEPGTLRWSPTVRW